MTNLDTNQTDFTTFENPLQAPNICPTCGANWQLGIAQLSHSEPWERQIGRSMLHHCIHVCKTLTEPMFNKFKEEVQQ